MTKENTINVSEIFHSVQGEGNTMGKPSVFLRLQACNLLCGNPQADKPLKELSQEEIEKAQGRDAEWTCDTIATWLEGEGWPVKDLVRHLFSEYCDKFLNGSQLVITGGEPMLQQDNFGLLIGGLQGMLAKNIRVEIETNGTIKPSAYIYDFVNQFNVSPKLSNSGMSEDRRINPESLEYLTELPLSKTIFKFVVTRKEDLNEILCDYLQPFDIPKEKVWLMPGCSNREQFEEVSPLVAEACQKHGFQFSSRLQINLWNQTTGV